MMLVSLLIRELGRIKKVVLAYSPDRSQRGL
jgi:hypothetical protein